MMAIIDNNRDFWMPPKNYEGGYQIFSVIFMKLDHASTQSENLH